MNMQDTVLPKTVQEEIKQFNTTISTHFFHEKYPFKRQDATRLKSRVSKVATFVLKYIAHLKLPTELESTFVAEIRAFDNKNVVIKLHKLMRVLNKFTTFVEEYSPIEKPGYTIVQRSDALDDVKYFLSMLTDDLKTLVKISIEESKYTLTPPSPAYVPFYPPPIPTNPFSKEPAMIKQSSSFNEMVEQARAGITRIAKVNLRDFCLTDRLFQYTEALQPILETIYTTRALSTSFTLPNDRMTVLIPISDFLHYLASMKDSVNFKVRLNERELCNGAFILEITPLINGKFSYYEARLFSNALRAGLVNPHAMSRSDGETPIFTPFNYGLPLFPNSCNPNDSQLGGNPHFLCMNSYAPFAISAFLDLILDSFLKAKDDQVSQEIIAPILMALTGFNFH